MSSAKPILIFCALAFLLGGCLDEIELKDQRFDTQAIIIQGRLILGSPSVVEINVERVGEYDGLERTAHIGSAKITLLSADGNSIEVPEVNFAKVYRVSIPQNSSTFKVQAGQSYRIKVNLLDGRSYESELEPLLPVPDLEKTSYTIQELSIPDKKGFITPANYFRFWINSSLFAGNSTQKSKLRWELHGVYRLTDDAKKVCYNYEPQRPEQVFLYDGLAAQRNRLDTFYLANAKLDHRFAEGFYLTVFQESLSSSAFRYWNQVKTLSERSGSMFEEPAAPISSNIRSSADPAEKVYGYFYATAQDTLRLYVSPAQAGSPTTYCPQPPTPRIGPTICDNCLLNTGSTLVKPAFWIQ